MMKRFRNCLIGLITFSLSFIGFSYGDGVVYKESANINHDSSPYTFQCNGYCCIFSTDTSSARSNSYFTYSGNDIYFNSFSVNDYYCMQYSGIVSASMKTSSIAHVVFYNVGNVFSSSSCPTCPECPTCPTCSNYKIYFNSWECDDGDCYYGYSSQDNITQNIWLNMGSGIYLSGSHVGNGITNYYLGSNEVSCPVYTGDENGSGWSALYINDIQHIGAGIINISIPEEFDWDYVYTGNGEQFDLDVKGYNVDSEYIDGIIRKQTTLPNNTDFSNIISGLIPLFVPGLVIIACLYFIFRFIKKVF